MWHAAFWIDQALDNLSYDLLNRQVYQVRQAYFKLAKGVPFHGVITGFLAFFVPWRFKRETISP
jgi:hypothetical protein